MDIKDFKEFRAAAERFIAEVYGKDGRTRPVYSNEATIKRKIRDVTVDILNANYGTDPYDRVEKLTEEVHELRHEAFTLDLNERVKVIAQNNRDHEGVKRQESACDKDCYNLLWEMSDVVAIMYQMIRNLSIACELDMNFFIHMMLQGCAHKHTMRKTNPGWGHGNKTEN